MLLYLGIAILQDSGYMARAAFVLDALMHRVGLHGKSFIPMLMGFGCTVPAVMSTRILDTRRDRLTTLMVLPLMSCGARLPVYVLIIEAFFKPRRFSILGLFQVTNQALMLFGIYVLGILLAVVAARALRGTVLRGEAGSFVMELPPYRLPAVKGLAVHTWERLRDYLRKAGTIILAIVVVLWALKTWPVLPAGQQRQYEAARAQLRAGQSVGSATSLARLRQLDAEEHRQRLLHSAIGTIGRGIAPALRPCGFDWKISTALLGSLAAKEVFIGQMAVIYAVGGDQPRQALALRAGLAADYTPLQGVCVMLFVAFFQRIDTRHQCSKFIVFKFIIRCYAAEFLT
jgi:ferrous iron transport protein B